MKDNHGERGPWHSGDEKPAHIGLYESLKADCEVVWRYWNGKSWGWGYSNKRWATSKHWREASGATQTDKWRGLANKP